MPHLKHYDVDTKCEAELLNLSVHAHTQRQYILWNSDFHSLFLIKECLKMIHQSLDINSPANCAVKDFAR